MAASNKRIREYDTVHHLMSRIAHRVFILSEDDRNDFIEIIRRSAEFVGIKLLGWCLMTNHFHILAHLPYPIELDEEEIFRRYGVLKGVRAMLGMRSEIVRLRANGCNAEADAWFAAQRKRMYDVGSFMKIAKQWFTEEYNRRHSHSGTLWEGEYADKPVKQSTMEMAKRLAYIHLNPIRAAITDRYDGYQWSSFSAFCRGDHVAVKGMQFIYDDGESQPTTDDMHAAQVSLMDDLLEFDKRSRAEEIARRRASGQLAQCDPLTTEALVIAASAHLEEVRRAGAAVWENGSNLFSQLEREVLARLYLNPSLEPLEMVRQLGYGKSSIYRALKSLKHKGVLERPDCAKPWIVHSNLGKQVRPAFPCHDSFGKAG